MSDLLRLLMQSDMRERGRESQVSCAVDAQSESLSDPTASCSEIALLCASAWLGHMVMQAIVRVKLRARPNGKHVWWLQEDALKA